MELVPVPLEVAVAVTAGQSVRIPHAPDWPHADTADALRPVALYGQGPGTFLVVEVGAVVGECGRLRGPDGDGAVEIGYGLAPSARGRGIGTAAVRALTGWVEAQPGVRRITAEVLVGNLPSRRLLERLGFTPSDPASEAGYVRYRRDALHVDRPDNSG